MGTSVSCKTATSDEILTEYRLATVKVPTKDLNCQFRALDTTMVENVDEGLAVSSIIQEPLHRDLLVQWTTSTSTLRCGWPIEHEHCLKLHQKCVPLAGLTGNSQCCEDSLLEPGSTKMASGKGLFSVNIGKTNISRPRITRCIRYSCRGRTARNTSD